ncbi:Bactericidal permeability-increasing protein-like protein [Aphelenchoides bicaudatus]|nr:Bactericidal permeability-increasing protein-like protein [Aphelenchoides bicaudatus]
MRLQTIFLLTVVAISEALSPGSQIQIAQNGIDNAVHSLIDYISKKFQSISIPEIQQKHLHVYDITLSQFSIDQQSTGIKLQDNGDISIHVGGINVNVDATFKAKWSIFHTKGTVSAKAQDASFDITLGINNENEKPRILNKGVSVNLGNLKVKVHGSIISWILDLLADIFKGKIKSKGEEKIRDMLNEKIQQLSDKIVAINTVQPLSGKLTDFFIDYGLMSDPTVANSAFIVPTATQFWYKDHKDQAPAKSSGSFPFGAPWQMVCADLDTNLFFGTLAYAYNVSGENVFVINDDVFKNLPQDIEQFFECNCTGDFCLIAYFPNLAAHCPKDGLVKIETTVTVQESLYFNDTGIFAIASGYSKYVAVAPDNTEIILFDLEADVGVHLLQNVTFDNWTVKGTVDVFYTQLKASSVFGDIDVKLLDKLWSFVLKVIAVKLANGYLESGIPLPPLTFATFKNTKLGFNGQFVRFCTDVDVNFENILN